LEKGILDAVIQSVDTQTTDKPFSVFGHGAYLGFTASIFGDASRSGSGISVFSSP
jgi:hypothetical protein